MRSSARPFHEIISNRARLLERKLRKPLLERVLVVGSIDEHAELDADFTESLSLCRERRQAIPNLAGLLVDMHSIDGGQLWWAQIGPFFPGRTAILMLEVMLGACESDPRKFLEDAGFWAGTRFGQVRALGGSGSVRRRVSRCCGAQDCTHGAGSQDFAV